VADLENNNKTGAMKMKKLFLLIILILVGVAFSANEVVVNYESGRTLYFIIRQADGLNAYDTTSDVFEVWNAMGDYDISLIDKSGSGYTASFEAGGEIPAGTYIVQAFERVGGAVADDDPLIGSTEFVWTGTHEAGTGGGWGHLLLPERDKQICKAHIISNQICTWLDNILERGYTWLWTQHSYVALAMGR
jgi:uncharacterized protein YxeA